MNKYFEVNNLSKDYTDSSGYTVHLLEDISFEIEEGSITSLLAPTGAGKSSLLQILSGLDTPTTGTVNVNSEKKKIVYIPSAASSFPWFSVKENLSLVSNDEEKINSVIKDVGLEGYENHFPDNNSLGFRFRISLARALAGGADVIILDEPFNKEIKPVTLARIYELVISIRKKYETTFIIGTSNLTESILLSDKVYLMQKTPGKIIDSIDISFTNDRNMELLSSPEFFDYRNKIEELLKKIVSQSLSNITV